jgi:hypothetical protein
MKNKEAMDRGCVGVSNLRSDKYFFMTAFRDLYGVLGGHKIYTSSDITSLHLVFSGSRYRHLVTQSS